MNPEHNNQEKQIQQIQKPDPEALSHYIQSSYMNYPYYFMEQERMNYIKCLQSQKQAINEQYGRQKGSFNNSQSIFNTKQFVIVKKMDNPRQKNIQQHYCFDRYTLKFLKNFSKEPSSSAVNEIYLKKKLISKQKKQVSFGRILTPHENLIKCSGKQIGNKQLKLRFSEIQQIQNQAVTIFILCWKKSPYHSHLCRVPYFCIKIITQYMTHYNGYEFQLVSCAQQRQSRRSEIMGTYLQLMKQMQFSKVSRPQPQYRLNANFDIKIKFVKIIRFDDKLKKQSESEDYGVQSYKQRIITYLKMIAMTFENHNVEIIGLNNFQTNLSVEQKPKTNTQTLILKIKTLYDTKYHVITNHKQKFGIGNGNFDIPITTTSLARGSEQAALFYRKQMDKWFLKTSLEEGIWIKMHNMESYGIRGKNVVRVGKNNYFEINIID